MRFVHPTEDQFVTQVMKHLFRSRGVDMSGYSESFVLRAIKKRVSRAGAADQMGYLRILLHSENETNELLGALSINVTEFFRDKGAFEALATRVVRPLLALKAAEGGVLRMWSAGCATGQETYTMAMCLAEELSELPQDKSPVSSILGTDISNAALAKAESGIYTKEEIKGIPEKLLIKYFGKKGLSYEACQGLTRFTRFARENILDKPGSRFFDAIVCRNVLIYFSRDMHTVVVHNLHEALRKGGYLMLGRTETLMGAPRSSFEVVDLENRILRKL